MRFLSVTSVPQTLHTLNATLLAALLPTVEGVVAVAVAVPPAVEHEQRRPTAAPVAVVFTPPHVGQIIRVDMSTSSSRGTRLVPPAAPHCAASRLGASR